VKILNKTSEYIYKVPNTVKEILKKLSEKGFYAYITGDCVRKLVMEISTQDYDIMTNAELDDLCSMFQDEPAFKTAENEITFKVAGAFVAIKTYSGSILDELAKRDFSFEAMVWNESTGLFDPFSGKPCLNKEQSTVSVIETFKNPEGILRALGYLASGEYIIDEKTKNALQAKLYELERISPEQCRKELSWVLIGKKSAEVLGKYSGVLLKIIPEFADIINGKDFTLTLKILSYSSPILELRYAILFHLIGKPDCFSADVNGNPRFYGYEERSAIAAERIMTRLCFKEQEKQMICYIIRNQNEDFAEYENLKQAKHLIKLKLSKIPPDKIKLLLQFKYAQTRGTANGEEKETKAEQSAKFYKRYVDLVNEITAMKECYKTENLAVTRDDLLKYGMSTEQADNTLKFLFETVLEAPALNTKSRLFEVIKKTKRL
jgi:tRNA nucleotidyltransferase (CCA-adding enzyme)